MTHILSVVTAMVRALLLRRRASLQALLWCWYLRGRGPHSPRLPARRVRRGRLPPARGCLGARRAGAWFPLRSHPGRRPVLAAGLGGSWARGHGASPTTPQVLTVWQKEGREEGMQVGGGCCRAGGRGRGLRCRGQMGKALGNGAFRPRPTPERMLHRSPGETSSQEHRNEKGWVPRSCGAAGAAGLGVGRNVTEPTPGLPSTHSGSSGSGPSLLLPLRFDGAASPLQLKGDHSTPPSLSVLCT